MKKLALPVLFALCAGSAHAQLYKWVGPDGKVTYSDTPPPADARAEARRAPAPPSAPAEAGLPYRLAQAARSHPVVLYTTSNCLPCDEGRQLLHARGIPFQEKTVSSNEDMLLVRQAGGDGLPLLTVGRTAERGFQPTAWNRALTAAGYPETSQLPPDYRNPPPAPAAPRKEEEKAPVARPEVPEAQESPPPLAEEVPAPAGNAPPGFRF